MMEEKNMESTKLFGIISIILGLIFIVFPFFGTVTLSVLIGISLLFFGIIFILSEFSAINIIIGILAILVGFVFITNIAALSFLIAFQFYVIGILMIIAGIAGLISNSEVPKFASILIVILGIISFALGGFSLDQPIFAPILIGVALLVEGIGLCLVE